MIINKEDYVSRIKTASPVSLVVITYELFLKNLEQAQRDDELALSCLKTARGLLQELVVSLDFSIQISASLFAIYTHVNGLLAKSTNNKQNLKEACQIMQSLYEGWCIAEKDPQETNTLEKNVNQTYAGLTYDNKGNLAEYTISSRDIEA